MTSSRVVVVSLAVLVTVAAAAAFLLRPGTSLWVVSPVPWATPPFAAVVDAPVPQGPGVVYEVFYDEESEKRAGQLASNLDLSGPSVSGGVASFSGSAGSLIVDTSSGVFRFVSSRTPRCRVDGCAFSESSAVKVAGDVWQSGGPREDFSVGVQTGLTTVSGFDDISRRWSVSFDGDGTVVAANGFFASFYPLGSWAFVDRTTLQQRLLEPGFYASAPLEEGWRHASDVGIKPSVTTAHLTSPRFSFAHSLTAGEITIQRVAVSHEVVSSPSGRVFAVPVFDALDVNARVWRVFAVDKLKVTS